MNKCLFSLNLFSLAKMQKRREKIVFFPERHLSCRSWTCSAHPHCTEQVQDLHTSHPHCTEQVQDLHTSHPHCTEQVQDLHTSHPHCTEQAQDLHTLQWGWEVCKSWTCSVQWGWEVCKSWACSVQWGWEVCKSPTAVQNNLIAFQWWIQDFPEGASTQRGCNLLFGIFFVKKLHKNEKQSWTEAETGLDPPL